MNERRVPVRRGPVYCSPACGCGCSYVAYQRAVVCGLLLALQMGPGWKTTVWENMGWHFAVRKGCARISANIWQGGEEISYSCYYNPPGSSQVVKTSDSAPEALGRALRQAADNNRSAREALDAFSEDCWRWLL